MATASTSRRTDAGHLVVLSRSITDPRHMGPVMILAVEFASGGFAQEVVAHADAVMSPQLFANGSPTSHACLGHS